MNYTREDLKSQSLQSFFFACWVIFTFLLSSVDVFFSKLTFRNAFRVSNALHSDQDQRSAGPDIGLTCLKRLSVDDKIRWLTI